MRVCVASAPPRRAPRAVQRSVFDPADARAPAPRATGVRRARVDSRSTRARDVAGARVADARAVHRRSVELRGRVEYARSIVTRSARAVARAFVAVDMSAQSDRAALLCALGVVVARVAREIARARAYGPSPAGRGATGRAWTAERERAAFEKDGRAPRGKRLAMLAVTLLLVGGSTVFAALTVSMPRRARMERRDLDGVARELTSLARRRISVRVWVDFEGGEAVARDVIDVKLNEMSSLASFDVVVPGSASCAGASEAWSKTLSSVSDNDIDTWIRDNSCASDNSRYDFVMINSESPQSTLVIGRHRAAWMRYNFQGDWSDAVAALESQLVTFLSRLSFADGDNGGNISPFLASSDGVLMTSFTLLNAEPKVGYAFTWDFERDVERHMLGALPFSLSRLVDVRIESQVLRHAPSRIRPVWSAMHEGFVVRTDQIPFFVDSEWPIDTSVTYAPVDGKPLQFVAYVPPAQECPLYILNDEGRKSDSNTFLIEGWGGVVIVNPQGCAARGGASEESLSVEELAKVINVFVGQLRIHLGLEESLYKFGAIALPPNFTGFTAWEIDSLVHARFLSDSHAAVSTLKSLDEVISSIGDIAVPEFIVEKISSSINSLERASRLAESGNYDEASVEARVAYAGAEAAFFDPFSLGGLESFALEGKVAAVIPVLLPAVFPLLLQFIREARHFQVRRRCAMEVVASRAKSKVS